MKKYVCTICGYIYEEAAGIPAAGIAAGTRWRDLPDAWVCPVCGAAKEDFKEQEESKPAAGTSQMAARTEDSLLSKDVPENSVSLHFPKEGPLHELSVGELSALCSNLARGCEKQYLSRESALFSQLSQYFKDKTPEQENPSLEHLTELVQRDLNEGFENANTEAQKNADRGAQRALVWSEKVSRILNSLLSRYAEEGGAFLAGTRVYVCEICGFIYIGDTPPDICPVCKVPGWKIAEIERRAN